MYKYFGQLELLELRFAEIRVIFPWRDAFTNKLITQTSIAYEKASIIFQIAATHSAIAASQNPSWLTLSTVTSVLSSNLLVSSPPNVTSPSFRSSESREILKDAIASSMRP